MQHTGHTDDSSATGASTAGSTASSATASPDITSARGCSATGLATRACEFLAGIFGFFFFFFFGLGLAADSSTSTATAQSFLSRSSDSKLTILPLHSCCLFPLESRLPVLIVYLLGIDQPSLVDGILLTGRCFNHPWSNSNRQVQCISSPYWQAPKPLRKLNHLIAPTSLGS